MVFSSLTFLLLFLPLLYLALFLFKDKHWRNGVLIVFSLFFYGWGEPVWISAMLFSTAVNYICARLLCAAKSGFVKKLWLTLGVIASICFLFYFKYSAFLFNSFAELFRFGFRMEPPRLPIGISFYTFQILTYTVDVYRGKAPMLKNPLKLLLYISCFPQLIAGPVVQYGDIADQLDSRRILPDDFVSGMRRFVLGLSKKVLLANICGAALEELTLAGSGASMSLAGGWLGAFLYTLQLYFDFSAYSDMAIGLGKTLGFSYKENFNYPYVSRSITEFWRRWHISLGSFFRDYVYIPLGGNRKGTARTVLNMLIVWSLTGLWHGASWNFVAWGAYYGLLLILERFVLSNVLDRLPGLLRWALTFAVVMVGWVLFYYTDFANVAQHVLSLIGLEYSGGGFHAVALSDAAAAAVLRKYTVYPLLAFVLSLPVLPWLKSRLSAHEKLSTALQNLGTVSLLAVSLLFLVGQSYNPFIYFRF